MAEKGADGFVARICGVFVIAQHRLYR